MKVSFFENSQEIFDRTSYIFIAPNLYVQMNERFAKLIRFFLLKIKDTFATKDYKVSLTTEESDRAE